MRVSIAIFLVFQFILDLTEYCVSQRAGDSRFPIVWLTLCVRVIIKINVLTQIRVNVVFGLSNRIGPTKRAETTGPCVMSNTKSRKRRRSHAI